MFEKEAEDSFKCKKVLYKWETDKNSYINGFKDGATFGYNKAKEEGKVVVEHFEAYGQCRDSRKIASLEKENAELKRQVEQKQHLADVRLEQSLENYKLFSDERKARIDVDIALDDMTDQLSYAKTIIQDLLDNTDEYARQKAEDFLKENNNEQARTERPNKKP